MTKLDFHDMLSYGHKPWDDDYREQKEALERAFDAASLNDSSAVNGNAQGHDEQQGASSAAERDDGVSAFHSESANDAYSGHGDGDDDDDDGDEAGDYGGHGHDDHATHDGRDDGSDDGHDDDGYDDDGYEYDSD